MATLSRWRMDLDTAGNIRWEPLQGTHAETADRIVRILASSLPHTSAWQTGRSERDYTCEPRQSDAGEAPMGYRTFKDSRGIEWQAWDVVPQLNDRREGERRRETSSSIAIVDDRRGVSRERRTVVGRRPVLSAGLGSGWLCFEAQVEKRRLAPIPADWLRCDEACLERYRDLAKPALRISAAIDLNMLGTVRN